MPSASWSIALCQPSGLSVFWKRCKENATGLFPCANEVVTKIGSVEGNEFGMEFGNITIVQRPRPGESRRKWHTSKPPKMPATTLAYPIKNSTSN